MILLFITVFISASINRILFNFLKFVFDIKTRLIKLRLKFTIVGFGLTWIFVNL